MKILVMDDEELFLKLCQKELSEAGYAVVTAASRKEALELFDKEEPDLVTLDIDMKYAGEDQREGISILEEMKGKRKDVPIILLTAYEHRADFRVWCADAYITKSSDPAELKETIRSLLQGKEQ